MVPRLAIDQTTGAFGAVEAGSVSTPNSFQISNAGGDYTGPLEVVVEGARFRIATNSCSMDTVFAGATCEVRVVFAPVAVEGSIGRLVVRGMPGGEVSAALAGTGTSPTTATLTVSKSGTGSGTVTGMGIACGADCSDVGPVNRQLMLTAAALPGSQFAGWTGCDSVTSGTCSVTMASSRSVTARFTGNSMMGAMATLTVMKTGPGTISGMGISCGADCSESAPVGTTITLTATPMSGSTFVDFLGCDTMMGRSCTLTLNGSRSISATFEAAATDYVLTVAKSGSGMGTITGTDITCGTDCNEVVPAGQMRTVSAVPASNSVLSGWLGCTSTATTNCTVALTSTRTVTAAFGLQPGSLMVSVPTGSTTGTFTVSWSCGSGACGSPFTLEEDVNPSFGSPTTVATGTATSQAFTNKADGRSCYRVRTPVMTSNVACIVVSRPGSTGVLRIENLTKYDVIDYRLNGTQRTNYPYVLSVGASDDVVFPPGIVTYDLGVGFWNGSTREVWFLYSGTAQVFAGQTTLVSIDNPSLQQVLTNFGPAANWDGRYLSSGMLRTRRMAFDPAGSYTLLDNGAQVGWGTVELVDWPNYATTISFRLCTPVCGGTPIELVYPFNDFVAPNGPPASPDVTYFLQ